MYTKCHIYLLCPVAAECSFHACICGG